ncbi:MAG: ECF transporter S component [Firmicutes bacterium]|nr:ECF transporter S component [Bacillota bacterium]
MNMLQSEPGSMAGQGKGQKRSTLTLVRMAMLIAVSSVLVFLCFPLIPSAPFLKYDMADVPVLFAAFTMGWGPGMIVLTVASFIQAFLFGHDGPIGFLMHMIASGTLVTVAYAIYAACRKTNKGLILALICGSIAMALIMIPLNFIFTPKVLMDVPIGESARIFFDGLSGGYTAGAYSEAAVTAYQTVKGMLLVALIPFNLLKAGLNSLLFYLVYRSIRAWKNKKRGAAA